MSKYLETKKGSLESAVLEAMSPAQQAAIAISKKEKEKTENNFIHAAKMAKEKGEKTFTIGGKEYDVEETIKTEKLVGGQKKLDKDGDGDIDGKDFAAMRKKAKKEEVELQEKPADYLELEFNSSRDAAKAYDYINNKLYTSGRQPFNMQPNEGSSLQFEDMDDADKVMAELKKAKFKFKVYERESVNENKMKDMAMKIDDIVAKMKKDSKMKSFADKFKKDAEKSMDIAKSLEKVLPDYVAGKDIQKLMASYEEVQEGFSPKQIKMAIGVASDKRYAGGNMSGAVAAIDKIKKGLSDHPQVAAVLKRQNESLAEKAARHISDMWKESASAKDKKEDKKVKEEDEGSDTTMTGKPASKIAINPKSKEEK